MIEVETATWVNGPETARLAADDVHLWRARLDHRSEKLAELQQKLSGEEREFSCGFAFVEDRHRYIVSHGLLRDILGRYVKPPDKQVKIIRTANGKPELLGCAGGSGLQFGLAHSEDLFIVALTWNRRIGVDIESIANPSGWDAIAKENFAAREYSATLNLPSEQRHNAFLKMWTHKEAYLKGRGEGLRRPLASFMILEYPAGDMRVDDSFDPEASSAWRFQEFVPDAFHLGTLAVNGTITVVHHFDWSTC